MFHTTSDTDILFTQDWPEVS